MAVLSQSEIDERRAALDKVMGLMQPAVEADGGALVLKDVDLETGVVEVELQGACSSCALSGATLQEGVERILKGRLPWVSAVTGNLDETIDAETSRQMGTGAYVAR